MGQFPGLMQEVLELGGGHPDGVVRPAVAPAAAAHGAAFQIAAQGVRQSGQRGSRRVKVRGFQIQRPGIDDFLILKNTVVLILPFRITVVAHGHVFSRRLCGSSGHVGSLGNSVGCTAAAGGQR